MKRFETVRKSAAVLLLAGVLTAVCAAAPAIPASASEEAAANTTLPETTLKENSSDTTGPYFGVINLTVADNRIAYASVDSKNRVVVTAVGDGSTTVTYWCKMTADDSWVRQTLPVRVSGRADPAGGAGSASAGVAFPASSVTVSRSESYSMTGMKRGGESVAASALLWVSSDDSVLTVGKRTGVLKGISAGTATLFAIDPISRTCGSVVVTVE